jgi:enamine deaminase RidA (YjgF/YER057c/UK114 family)
VSAEQRLKELELELPPAPRPIASYVPVVVSGPLAFVSGQVPMAEGKLLWSGKLGVDLDVGAGAEAARRCALQCLSALRAELGSLDRVRRVVRMTVYVASAAGFVDQPAVANGASDLLVKIFGEEGKHARVAVSSPELPLGSPVEVEMIVEVRS